MFLHWKAGRLSENMNENSQWTSSNQANTEKETAVNHTDKRYEKRCKFSRENKTFQIEELSYLNWKSDSKNQKAALYWKSAKVLGKYSEQSRQSGSNEDKKDWRINLYKNGKL